jgi:hypothetical protein
MREAERTGQLTGEDLGRCPFCGGDLAATILGSPDPGVIHSLPTCEKFDALEPIAFLRACRERKAG